VKDVTFQAAKGLLAAIRSGKIGTVSARIPPPAGLEADHCSTLEAARLLGMAVRSVQMMVDRGELRAWKTPGGHRRIARASIEEVIAQRLRSAAGPGGAKRPMRVLLIEDSAHFQNLLSMLVSQHLPGAEVHVADDGIVGLAMAGQLQPDLLVVDILLPGIDGGALITSLRSHPQFSGLQLVVVTSLEAADREAYAYALRGLPVVHKTRLVSELPGILAATRTELSPSPLNG
jgi:excisionase family DNA binding protein